MLRSRSLIAFGVFAVLAAFALALTPFNAAGAFSTGQFRHNGSPSAGGATCANCHDGDAPGASVSIDVPTSMSVGETTTITVAISGGPGAVAGFNAATEGLVGTIQPVDADTQLVSDEATHTGALSMANGPATFRFEWTAPGEATTVDWYVASVSANGDGTTAGDAVATAVRSIVIEPAPTPTPRPAIIDDPAEPVAAPTATPVPEIEPVQSGVHGFGLDPQPAPTAGTADNSDAVGGTGGGDASAEPGLAATGSSTVASASIAGALFALGASCVVAARRSQSL